jgi:hypothetical protein
MYLIFTAFLLLLYIDFFRNLVSGNIALIMLFGGVFGFKLAKNIYEKMNKKLFCKSWLNAALENPIIFEKIMILYFKTHMELSNYLEKISKN